MTFREIELKDIPAVVELISRNFDEIMSKSHSKSIIEKYKVHNSIDNLKQQMKWKEIYIIENNDEIIATAALANFSDNNIPFYSLSNFYVKPELQNQGIGKHLFNQLIEIFKTIKNIINQNQTKLEKVLDDKTTKEFLEIINN